MSPSSGCACRARGAAAARTAPPSCARSGCRSRWRPRRRRGAAGPRAARPRPGRAPRPSRSAPTREPTRRTGAPQSVGVRVQVRERRRLRADVAARDRVLGVAGDPQHAVALDLHVDAAVRLAQRALAMNRLRHPRSLRRFASRAHASLRLASVAADRRPRERAHLRSGTPTRTHRPEPRSLRRDGRRSRNAALCAGGSHPLEEAPPRVLHPRGSTSLSATLGKLHATAAFSALLAANRTPSDLLHPAVGE